VPQGMKGQHKFKWESVETFADSGPKPIPQPPSHKQMGLSNPDPSEISASCSTWGEPVAVSSKPSTTMFSMSRYGRNAALDNQFVNDADGFNSQDASNFPLGQRHCSTVELELGSAKRLCRRQSYS
jgi:hypothetical protein